LRKTVKEHRLINPGDRIAVGLSGGKDSMALLHALKHYQSFSPDPFELEAITIDLGFENFDLDKAKAFCHELGVPYTITKTEIAKIVFDYREEKNPCSLCANMRRGALANTMNEQGLNVLALGHHADDALSTLFMNTLYAGKLNTLEYYSFLSRSSIHLIRPLLDASEASIKGYVKSNSIPILKSPCPMDQKTKREEINHLLKSIYKEIPDSRKNMLTAMRNSDQCNLFKNAKEPL
ncbi:MAG TPA: tRNA 2-thiocytidine(32) synthetase TtcA, partial [Clostridiales bacterium UBA8960]|nr:tRNA 2-thiocytidine(32) synthetase TtcA [Clostridiales bacterium UBA8960]